MAESEADRAYISELVRTYDRPRYYSVLFAPKALREDLLALYAFAAEIGRIPDQVKEAALGEMRLQWWHDSLRATVAGESGANPTLRGIAGAIARHALPLKPFLALIDARTVDLYADPPLTIGDLEGKLGETQSALFQLASVICGARGPDSADAAGHAGVAYGLAVHLSTLAGIRAKGRAVLPVEVLRAEGLDVAAALASPPRPELIPAVRAVAEHGRRHLILARQHLRSAPRQIGPAFLPLAVVEPLLRRITKEGGAILERPVILSDLDMLTRIGLARLSGSGRGAGRVR